MSLPSLTNVLVYFEERLSSGRSALFADVSSLAGILVAFEVAFAGMYLALGSSADFRAIARKVLTVGFFFYVVRNYADILRWLVDGFLFAGEKVGSGSTVNFATLRDPGQLFAHGLTLTKPLVYKVFADLGSSWVGVPSLDSMWLIICILSALFAFAFMSIHVFVTYLEDLLVASAGFILIPFGMFKPTAFMAERVFGAILAFGVKLMTLALIIGISDSFLQTIVVPEGVTWQDAIEVSVIALALCYLTIHAPAVAQSLLTGSPNLSISMIAATAATANAIKGTAGATLTAAGQFAGGATTAVSSMPPPREGASGVQRVAQRAAQGALFAAGGVGGILTGMANGPVTRGIQKVKDGVQSVPGYRMQHAGRAAQQARQDTGTGGSHEQATSSNSKGPP